MNSAEQPPLDEISLHIELETVARELSILDETMHEFILMNRHLAASAFAKAKIELLTDPSAYVSKQAETARKTWLEQPAIAKYIYQDDSE